MLVVTYTSAESPVSSHLFLLYESEPTIRRHKCHVGLTLPLLPVHVRPDGGHYLPTTAAAIMDFNVDVAAGHREGPSLQQFRGLLVGNPYTNPAENNKVGCFACAVAWKST